MKRVFLRFYDQYKKEVLLEILELMEFEGDKNKKAEELKNVDKFTEFSSKSSGKKDQNNWHVLMNNIDNKIYRGSLKRIVVKLFELRREVDFFVRVVDIEDEEILHRLRYLDRGLQDGRFKEELDWNLGEDKDFTNGLHELLSGESFSGSYGDFIRKWVEKA